jgi:hypothetical protein
MVSWVKVKGDGKALGGRVRVGAQKVRYSEREK